MVIREKNIETYNNSRVNLRECVPIEFPFSMQISVGNSCNFRCYYCSHSNSENRKRLISHGTLNIDDYKRVIDNIAKYGVLKQMPFSGLGETLLYKGLPDLIAYAQEKGVTRKTIVVTNGTLLTKKLSEALLSAGLDEIRISLQGLSVEEYKVNASVNIDFDKFLEDVAYFFANRGTCKVYIKIIDKMVETDAKKYKFDELFGSISDELNIESLLPTNGNERADTSEYTQTLRSGAVREINVCPLPFYQTFMDCNGDLCACCAIGENYFRGPIIGNLYAQDFADIWNKGVHRQLCLDMLEGRRTEIPECTGCNAYKYQTSPRDHFDGSEDEIKERLMSL
jgi:MoaA/NifB/PqqE/SkfB family radical SAM enzyme